MLNDTRRFFFDTRAKFVAIKYMYCMSMNVGVSNTQLKGRESSLMPKKFFFGLLDKRNMFQIDAVDIMDQLNI